MSIAERVAQVRGRIAAAAARVGRDPGEVTLIGVSKLQPVEKVREALAAGLTELGENYVQELLAKMDACPGATWHFIGGLQTNKARLLVGRVALVHSVDRERLLVELSRRSVAAGVVTPILLEVNVGGEASKSGAAPGEIVPLARLAAASPGIALRGLMAIPPPVEDPEDARPAFRAVRALAEEVDALGLPGVSMAVRSYGMSHDFEIAVEEGATHVRVGTALFGARPSAA